MKIYFLLTYMLVFLIACGGNNKNQINQGEEEKVVQVRADNAEMNEAMAKASSTYENFKKVFIENKKTNLYDSFLVKVGFESTQFGKEHMWVNDIELDGTNLVGFLSSVPMDEDVKYKVGDKIVIDPKDVSDWIYTEKSNGVTHGGYTFKAMRDKMSPKEQVAFDEEVGLKFEWAKE